MYNQFKLGLKKYLIKTLVIVMPSILLFYNSAITSEISLGDVSEMLRSEYWHIRESGAFLLLDINEIGFAEKADTLIKALENEINNPLSMEKSSGGSYISVTERLKRKYSSAICSLGVHTVDMIREKLSSASGELELRLIFILGFLGDESVHQQISAIYLESSDGNSRMFAIKALMSYKDTLDIPIFKQALNDPYKIEKWGDVGGYDVSYIIRPIAGGALIDMGFEVKRKGTEYIITKER